MKHLFIGNSMAWLRLVGAIAALALASSLAKPTPHAGKTGAIVLAGLQGPGAMREW